MTFRIFCVVTPGMREERIPRNMLRKGFIPYWFHADGRQFTNAEAYTEWSNSTLIFLVDHSGRFLYDICNGDSEEVVRLNTRRIQKAISKIKQYVADNPPNISCPERAAPTILNMIATFDIMVERFGDDARFCIA